MCLELHNRTETTSGLPPAFLHDVNGPVDGARRPAHIPVPHFEVAILDRGGQIHTVSRQTHVCDCCFLSSVLFSTNLPLLPPLGALSSPFTAHQVSSDAQTDGGKPSSVCFSGMPPVRHEKRVTEGTGVKAEWTFKESFAAVCRDLES